MWLCPRPPGPVLPLCQSSPGPVCPRSRARLWGGVVWAKLRRSHWKRTCSFWTHWQGPLPPRPDRIPGPLDAFCVARGVPGPVCPALSLCVLVWRLSVLTLPVAGVVPLAPCMTRQCPAWLHLDHSPGALVCFCIVELDLCPDLTPGCGVEWAGPGCLPLLITCGEVATTRAWLSPPWLSASQHAPTLCKWSLGFSSPSVCLCRFASSQGG